MKNKSSNSPKVKSSGPYTHVVQAGKTFYFLVKQRGADDKLDQMSCSLACCVAKTGWCSLLAITVLKFYSNKLLLRPHYVVPF